MTFKKVTALFLIPLTLFFISFSGCGSGSSTSDLERAYEAYIDEDYTSALAYSNASIEHSPTKDAYIFKSQVQYVMEDKTGAAETLSEFNELYPDDGEDDLLNAVYLSLDTGDCDQIHTYLQTALDEDYAGIECEPFWALIEEDDVFSYFRESCSTQYDALEDSKSDCEDETLAGCKQNRTKFVSSPLSAPLGPQLWMNNTDTVAFSDNSYIINFVLRAAPLPMPVKVIVAAAILARKIEVKAKNRGCGVVLYWLWVTFPSNAFWMEAQK